ncbi:alkaline phosphatase family protein [Fulvivirga ligni]|uniref:alkaline phosphatase family protein n=1 Tax=Fulvivirga ligni TaxID=2904246 RepID=UPI001F1D4846|nr:alkaline phosphatase family protein [Fulvivirga ligni]UII22847.1 alkaline phosphatase family protein [Fulvivirga ligni]
MRKIYLFALSLLALGCQPKEKPQQQEETTNSKTKKAVFIILDGIPTDVLKRVNTPHLDAIAKDGGFADIHVGGEKGTYNETPTISAPGYIDLLTGTWANKHNVWNNYNQEPNYNYWNIFRIAETVKPELKTAIFSSWLDNRTILVGEGQQDAGNFKIDYAFDGFEKDTVRFPHDPRYNYIGKIDSLVSAETASYIASEAPDLSWVYLEHTDDIGHALGDSELFDNEIIKADKKVGAIYEAIKKREKDYNEDWMIVVTTDHGRDPETGKHHGGQSDRERHTWLATNQKEVNTRFQEGNMAIIDITPSILTFLNIELPAETKKEIDGTSFIRAVSADQLKAEYDNGQLNLSWHVINSDGNGQLKIAFSNDHKTGGKDEYQPIGEVEISTGKAKISLSAEQKQKIESSKFAKVILETPSNTLNRWIVLK